MYINTIIVNLDYSMPQLQSFSGVMEGRERHFGSHLSGAGGSFRSTVQLATVLKCHEPHWSTSPRGSTLPSRGSNFSLFSLFEDIVICILL